MSSLFDTPIRMAREMRQRYFSDDCSPMSAFTGIFRDYHIELQYESHGDSLRREGETYIITLPRNTSPERDVYTIAHEIGHIVLGHTLDAAGMLVRSRDLPRRKGRQMFLLLNSSCPGNSFASFAATVATTCTTLPFVSAFPLPQPA